MKTIVKILLLLTVLSSCVKPIEVKPIIIDEITNIEYTQEILELDSSKWFFRYKIPNRLNTAYVYKTHFLEFHKDTIIFFKTEHSMKRDSTSPTYE